MDWPSSLFYRMKDIIYKQSIAGQCGSYACLNTLQKLWVDISEEKMLSLGIMWGFPAMEKILVKNGLISSLSYIIAPKRVDTYLAKWEKLVVLIYSNNFDSVRSSPYIQDFKGKMNHFVCMVEDCGDTWKVCDQQWENFADKGYWYIKKSDYRNIRIAKINL